MNRDGQVESKMPTRFRTYDGPSVITKRNFGLLRGKTLHEAPQMLVKTGSVSPPSTPDSGGFSPSSSGDHIGPISEHRRPSGPLDKAAGVWDWPLGEPKVFNCDDFIEARFTFTPFLPEEIWADVMGNELMIHCKTEKSWIGHREIFRCYTLPMNVNPRTAEFTIVQDKYLRIVIKKDVPLKLAIAFYGLDLDDSEVYDDRSDSEMMTSSMIDDQVSI